MEDQIKEALHNAGMTEELTANGEAAKKAMEAKAEAAAASEAKIEVEENKNDSEKETDMNTEKKWDAKRIIKWTAITLGCVAVGIGAALLLKNREAVAAAAEATTEATE